jgi:hypothetical protein
LCAYFAREGFRSPVFVATVTELRKDMEVMGTIQPQTSMDSPRRGEL